MVREKQVFSPHSPFYNRQGEAINSAEEFDRSALKHGMRSESGHELWSPDHRPLIHIFVQHLPLYLNRETGIPMNIKLTYYYIIMYLH